MRTHLFSCKKKKITVEILDFQNSKTNDQNNNNNKKLQKKEKAIMEQSEHSTYTRCK